MAHTKDLVPMATIGVMPMGRAPYAPLLREVLLALWLHRIQGVGIEELEMTALPTYLVACQINAVV